MSTLFVLMMLWSSTGSYRPPSPEHVEFTTERKCEDALAFWRSVSRESAMLVAGKCFQK